MEKLGKFIDYYLEMLNKILKAVKVVSESDTMIDDIGDAVREFGEKVEGLKD